MKYDSV